MRIGIIGGGAAGLVTAWLLQEEHEVCLFEKQERLGGHSHTIDVDQDGQAVPIDAGFEFFMDGSIYPAYHRLLATLGVSLNKFPASLTIFNPGGGRAIVQPPWRDGKLIWSAFTPTAISDMIRFRQFLGHAIRFLKSPDPSLTIGQFLDGLRLPSGFRREFVYPLLLGQFCMEPQDFDNCLARDVLKYTASVTPDALSMPNLFEIRGGTRAYISCLVARLKRTRIVRGSEILSIRECNGGYSLDQPNGQRYCCDHVVIATNARTASGLVSDLPGAGDVGAALDGVEYYPAQIAVHGDRRWMPEDRRHWSVVNFRYDGTHSSISVWKPWRSRREIFRSWISFDKELPDPLYARITYEHPQGNAAYYRAQEMVKHVQGRRRLWFAGSYTWDIDSHESAIRSAVEVARGIGVSIPDGWI